MRTVEEIVKLLRCCSTVHPKGEEPDCESCPYYLRAEPNEDLERLCAYVPDDFWDLCDYDRICLDAAEMIERLVNDKSTV